jgi:glycosyltransferase involved in cell wall biosynthesis
MIKSKNNKYYFIDVSSKWAKTKKYLHHFLYPKTYYHFSIDYFLSESIKHISKHNYDMIILNNRPGYSERLQGRTKAKLVYNLYNDKLNNNTPNYQALYDAATLIISTSNYITNRVKTIGDYANKCITIYSGIDLNNFSPYKTSTERRRQLGLNDNDFVLVFSGRVTEEKGIMELIKAIKKIRNIPNIRLLIIGSNFFGNDDNNNEFAKSLIRETDSIKEKVIFTGFVPYSQMPSYLKISNVAVIPSVWDDPLPTTVLEAQAMGLPIITTLRGGIPEEVTDENAILLKTDEDFIDNLASAILDLYSNPDKRKHMSDVSTQRAQLFDKTRYAMDFYNALETKIQF